MSLVLVGTTTGEVEDEDEEAEENDNDKVNAGEMEREKMSKSDSVPPSSPPRTAVESETVMRISASPSSTQGTRRRTRSFKVTRQNENTEEARKITDGKKKKRMKRTSATNRDPSVSCAMVGHGNSSSRNVESHAGVSSVTNKQSNKQQQQSNKSDPTCQIIKTKPHICEDCGHGFARRIELLVHIRRVHSASEERKHECKICKTKFLYPSDLRTHARTHKGDVDKLMKCPECGVGFNSGNALFHHRRHVHTTENSNSNVMYDHISMIQVDPDRYRYRCKNCGLQFYSKDAIQFHQFCNKKGEGGRFICKTCGKAFAFQNSLVRHNTSIHGGRSFPCEICKMPYTIRKSLNRHAKCHTGDSLTRCSECDAGFNNKRALYLHLCFHKENGDCEYFTCQKCGIKSKDESYFCAHLRSHPGASTPNPHLQNDVDGSDNSVDIFAPTEPKSGHQGLANHLHRRIHSGRKPFVCDVCNAPFLSSWKLRVHTKCHSKIAGRRPLECQTCGVKFNSRRSLTAHLLRHKSEAESTTPGRFQCQICATLFTLKRNRDIHIRLKHQPKVLLRRLDATNHDCPEVSDNTTVIEQCKDTATATPSLLLDSPRSPTPPPRQNSAWYWNDNEADDMPPQCSPSNVKEVEPHPVERYEWSQWNLFLPEMYPAEKANVSDGDCVTRKRQLPPLQNLAWKWDDNETEDICFPTFPSSLEAFESHPRKISELSQWNLLLPDSHRGRKGTDVDVTSEPQLQQMIPPAKKPERLEHATIFVVALPMPIIYLPTGEMFLIDQNFECKSVVDII